MNFQEHDIEWNQEKISRLWNYYQNNPSYSNHFFGLQHGRHVAKLIDDKIKFKNAKKILDFSCGRGDIIDCCLNYLKDGQQLWGTDFSEFNVNYVNARFEGVAKFKEARLVKSLPTSFSDGEFDLIISTEVIEHLNDEEVSSMLGEAYRLLSPKGYIFITTPNEEDREASKILCPDCGCMFHRWQHLRSWTTKTLQQTVEQYGFQTKLVTPIAWGGSFLERNALKFAVLAGLKKKDGLVYVGQKLAL